MKKSMRIWLATTLGFAGIVAFIVTETGPVSALTYQTKADVEFTFEPVLNITVSGDLRIDDLTPGLMADSNTIQVTVNTNNAYGYTLSATTGNTTNPSQELRHSAYTTNNAIFSNLSLDANLAKTDFNTDVSYNDKWGYSLDGTTYNGLPLYTDTEHTATLLTSTYMPTNGTASTNFLIGAKASADKIAGTYTNVVNFVAVGGTAPMDLAASYAAANKTKISVNGGSYYKMQDMNSSICANTEVEDYTLQVVDTRDNKV